MDMTYQMDRAANACGIEPVSTTPATIKGNTTRFA
jgi:hypothetical protein